MQNNQEQPILISVEEAAKLMGVGRRLMLNLVKLDDCPSVRLSKRTIKVNKQQFIDWVNNLTSVNWDVVKTFKEI